MCLSLSSACDDAVLECGASDRRRRQRGCGSSHGDPKPKYKTARTATRRLHRRRLPLCEPDVHHYSLTHASFDHTTGCGSFDLGTIYCSGITARVLRAQLGVKQKLLHTLEPGEKVEINGVVVTALGRAIARLGHVLIRAHGERPPRAAYGRLPREPPIISSAVSATTCLPCRGAPGAAGPSSSNEQQAPRNGLLDTIYLDTTYAQPRWAFPPQPDSLRMLSNIVAMEREREPATLFIVGSYQVGKEKAIAAVAKAAGGRALVPANRALSLRLCHEWDDALHTESADASDVCVHVSPLGGMGQEAHETMKETLQRSNGRYKAVVMFRPTGWTFTRALADGGVNALPRVWAENDGCTRMYGVPYSEHSSHTELHNLVSALKPNRIVPTVNAESAEQREKLIGQFAKSMDGTANKRTLAWHFRQKTEEEKAAEAEAAKAKDAMSLDAVDLAQQQRLWSELTGGGASSSSAEAAAPTPPTAPRCDTSAASSSSSAAVQLPIDGDDPLLAQLRDIIGEGAPQEYLKGLLSDSNGDVELACSIHFGANGGVVPEASAEEAAAVAQEVSSSTSPALGASSSRGGPSSSKEDGDEDLALPPGTVAWVVGKEFKLYTSKGGSRGPPYRAWCVRCCERQPVCKARGDVDRCAGGHGGGERRARVVP